MDKKVTISDVARLADVSKATVSRVLNRPEIVAPEVQARIRQAMAELNYAPNRHARALSGVRTKTVGLLFFRDLWDLVLNPFWGMATSTVYEHLLANELDCNLIALGHSITSRERFTTPDRYRRFFATRNVDGFLVVGHMSTDQERYLTESELPAVIWGRPELPDSPLTYVDSDHRAGAALAVDHLASRGRRHIATITGDLALAPARDRLDGYTRAMAQAQLAQHQSLVAHGDFTRRSGADAMNWLLNRNNDLDAVFAANDEMAIGALEVLDQRGYSVPGQIAVVGFDNVALPQQRTQRLTTIGHDYNQIGAQLVAGLLDRMQGLPHQPSVISPVLIPGDTA
ncbi:LacI family DNA-binding transcriptional regulator [Microbacterium sp. HJ5]